MSKKGIAPIMILLIVVVVVALAAGAYYLTSRKRGVAPPTVSPSAAPALAGGNATTTVEIQGNIQLIIDPKADLQLSVPLNWFLSVEGKEMLGAPSSTASGSMSLYTFGPQRTIDAGGACASFDNTTFEQIGLYLSGFSPTSSPTELARFSETFAAYAHFATSTRVVINPYGVKIVYTTSYGCGGSSIGLSAVAYHNGEVYVFSTSIPLQKKDIPAAFNAPCEDGPICIGEADNIIVPIESKIADALLSGAAAAPYQDTFDNFYNSMGTLKFLSPDPDPSSWTSYQNAVFSFKYPKEWNLAANSGGVMVFSPSAPSSTFTVLLVASGTDVTDMNLTNAGIDPFNVTSIGNTVGINNSTPDFEMLYSNPFVGKQVVFGGQYDDIDIFDTIVNATSDAILSSFKVGDLSSQNPNAISFIPPPPTVSLTVNGTHGPLVLNDATAQLTLAWQGKHVGPCSFFGGGIYNTYLPSALWGSDFIPVSGATTTQLQGVPVSATTTFGGTIDISCQGRGSTNASDSVAIIIPAISPSSMSVGWYPDGGVVVPGKQYTIWWTGGAPTVDIQLWQTTDPMSFGNAVADIATGIQNKQYYTWTVPTTYSGKWFEIGVVSAQNAALGGRFDIATSTGM